MKYKQSMHYNHLYRGWKRDEKKRKKNEKDDAHTWKKKMKERETRTSQCCRDGEI